MSGQELERRPLGASGVDVSVVGLGGYWLGGTDRAAAAAVLEASFTAGVDWVDTSEGYFDGANEADLGLALGSVPAMKVGSKVSPWRTQLTSAGIRGACEASLRRLGREQLDVYLVHAPSTEVPLEETWTAMANLVGDGLVRSIGLSNFSIEDVRLAQAIRPVDVVQDGLSLIDNLAGRELFSACAQLGIAGVVYEPLANALLTGAITPDSDLSDQREWPLIFERLFAPGRFERSLDVVARLRALAQDWGHSVSQVAIAWCTHQRGVASVLAGTTSSRHAQSNGFAGSIRLTSEQLACLEALIPLGPAFL
jgi:myo-inositol catabolism protein IolS